MAPELVYELGGEEHRFRLDQDEITIGRSPENDLVIRDVSISRNHALLRKKDGDWRIDDLGSKNGTHVNKPGSSNASLKHGDEILLGKFPIVFFEEVEKSVALTPSAGDSVIDDASGTVLRHAVDFSALAQQQAPEDVSEKRRIDPERMQKLVAVLTQVSRQMPTNSPDDTLKQLMNLVFEHLPVERGCIMLWDEGKKDLVARTVKVRGAPEDEVPEMQISRTIAEKVYTEKASVLTTDAQEDSRFEGGASILALGIRSAMAAPIWRGDDVEGIIYVDTPLHVKAYDDFDLDLLSAMGNQAAVALEQQRLQESILQEKVSREHLERYHSPAVVERIKQAGGSSGEGLAADEREVTVLFADVVGFTSRCERLEPRKVAELLNRQFSVMAGMIFRHDGTLDKFIGDCVMAVFGAPLEQDDHALRAVAAAMDMREGLADLNSNLPEEERIEFRVGMHSGKVIAGDIGSFRRRDYTVLGATVNLASRLESSVAKAGQIIISDVTHDAVKEQFATVFTGEYQPKGISRVVNCYEVVGRRGSEDATAS